MHPVIRNTVKMSTNIFPCLGVRYASWDFVELRRRNNAKACRAFNSAPPILVVMVYVYWGGDRCLHRQLVEEIVQLKFNDLCSYVFYYCSFPSHPLHTPHALWDPEEVNTLGLSPPLLLHRSACSSSPLSQFKLIYAGLFVM